MSGNTITSTAWTWRKIRSVASWNHEKLHSHVVVVKSNNKCIVLLLLTSLIVGLYSSHLELCGGSCSPAPPLSPLMVEKQRIYSTTPFYAAYIIYTCIYHHLPVLDTNWNSQRE